MIITLTRKQCRGTSQLYHNNNIYEHWLTLVAYTDSSSDPEHHMPGDFGSSANTLWSLYGNEAKSRDESRIQPLKDDMDGLLVFVRSYFVRAFGDRH